ncbi:uncharacterized protein LOC143447846 [Clavelina lepadiformis]|uniref:uncharacterized protein LOC143447846 n=1 Tax=Clavelina lepadiformis TaxID=159417 RepID=UPI0040429A5E
MRLARTIPSPRVLRFAVILCVVAMSKVSAQGIFELNLDKFINDEGRNQTGRCCSASKDGGNTCSGPCRTAFRICLSHFQAKLSSGTTCVFGQQTTPVLGENTFSPGHDESFQNPVRFSFDFRWPGSFSLIIEMLHVNENSTNNIISTGSSEVLISKLIKSTSLLPATRSDRRWTRPTPYRHLKTELRYSYRVVCQENLYGPSCSKFCRPRNDVFGHYNCDENGDKVCLPGWTGESESDYCNTPICLDGCHATQGGCKLPDQCECKHGWKGKFCTECVPRPGCAHGTCKNRFECTCEKGWGGIYCNQDLNYCINHKPCKNGASCFNSGQGSYTCRCKPGYIGHDCEVEVNECESNPCQNGATCVDLIDDYQCMCQSGFSGRNCDETTLTCDDFPCQNEGICTEGKKHYQCTCPDRFFGFNCENALNICDTHPCKNGECLSTSSGYACRCNPGYTGTNCDELVNLCPEPSPCLNGGTCLNVTFKDFTCNCMRCECTDGFAGTRCQIVVENHDLLKPPLLKGQGSSHTETRIIMLNDTELTTSHWIAICFGSGVIVLLLVISAGCLFYHRRKVTLSLLQRKINQTSTSVHVNDLDLPATPELTADDQNSCSSTKTSEEDLLELSKIRTHASNVVRHVSKSKEAQASWEPYVSNGKPKDHPATISNKLNTFSIEEEDKKSSFHPNRVCKYEGKRGSRSSVDKIHETRSSRSDSVKPRPSSSYYEQSLPFVRHSCHSMSQLPTYEEVCEENKTLLMRGYKRPTNSDDVF